MMRKLDTGLMNARESEVEKESKYETFADWMKVNGKNVKVILPEYVDSDIEAGFSAFTFRHDYEDVALVGSMVLWKINNDGALLKTVVDDVQEIKEFQGKGAIQVVEVLEQRYGYIGGPHDSNKIKRMKEIEERAEKLIEEKSKEFEQFEKIEQIKNQLKAYGEQNGLRGLEGRIQRGLDPAGMLAVEETRNKIEKISGALGASINNVVGLTNELHQGAIWDKADILAKGDDSAIKVWMIMAEATIAGKGTEGDISEDEFILDLVRISKLLDEAVSDPSGFVNMAREDLINRSKEKFEIDDGVPFSGDDDGFIAMAINGYKSGVVEQGGLFYVGANELNFDILKTLGLSEEEREDRGRMATFYVNNTGESVVKKLYKGFAIVLNGDKEIAKELAKTGENNE